MKTALARIAYAFIGLVLGAAVCAALGYMITAVYPGGEDSWTDIGSAALGFVIGGIAGIVVSQIVFSRTRSAQSDGLSPRKRSLILTGWVIAPILLTPAILEASVLFGPKPPPTDAALLANFSRHRAAFDQLAQFCANVKQGEIADQKATDSAGEQLVNVPAGSAGVYHDLLRTARVPNGEWQVGKGEIDFTVWTARKDFSGPGVEKGYAYLNHPPAELVNNLDGYHGLGWEGTGYRHISGPWYLYYYFDDDDD